MRRRGSDVDYLEQNKPEFNMMALFMERMDRRSEARDLALETGELEAYYRTTMSLLMNVIPRFKQKRMDPEAIEDLKKKLLKIGSKLKNMAIQSEQLQRKNKLQYEEELFEYNIGLNSLMFDFGLIYPMQEIKTIEEMAAEDY